MESNKSVFSQLEEIEKSNTVLEAQNSEILSLLKDIKSNQKASAPLIDEQQIRQEQEKEALKTFIKSSKKKYIWLGENKDFKKAKTLLALSCVSLLIIAIISTIYTSMAFGLYSTFSLIENAWAICVGFILVGCLSSTKQMSDLKIKDYSTYVAAQNEDGTWYATNKEKKIFLWLRRLTYLSLVGNIICIWTNSSGAIAIIATIFEVVFVALTVCVHVTRAILYSGYGMMCVFTGKNASGDKTVSLVFDCLLNKLMPYEEYLEKYKGITE